MVQGVTIGLEAVSVDVHVDWISKRNRTHVGFRAAAPSFFQGAGPTGGDYDQMSVPRQLDADLPLKLDDTALKELSMRGTRVVVLWEWSAVDENLNPIDVDPIRSLDPNAKCDTAWRGYSGTDG